MKPILIAGTLIVNLALIFYSIFLGKENEKDCQQSTYIYNNRSCIGCDGNSMYDSGLNKISFYNPWDPWVFRSCRYAC